MSPMDDLREAYGLLGRVVRPTRWTTPLGLSRVRSELAALVMRGGSTSGLSLWEYDHPGLLQVPDAVEACERALARVEEDLHEHEVWALRTLLEEALASAAEARNHEAAAVTERTTRTHGLPTPDEVAEASRILTAPTEDEQTATVSDEEVAASMRLALDRLGIEGWTVEIADGKVSDMAVIGGRHRVDVRKGARFTDSAVRQLLVHEIGTHVLRRHCAENQASYPVRLPVGAAIRTEEGFAVWREHEAQVSFPSRSRIYAARVVAVDVALCAGIRDVIEALADYIGMTSAIGTAIRVKRGLVNPHEPGANVKDHVYFTGSRAVGTHLRQHPDDLGLLFAAKWPLEELWRVRDLAAAGLVDPAPSHLTDPRIVL